MFPLAFPVDDLAQARRFYGEVLGCTECLSASNWIDFDFFGRQVVAACDAPHVTVRRFGTVLGLVQWDALAERLRRANVRFLVEPHCQAHEAAGEVARMALLDPFGNGLEFQAYL